MPTLPESFDHFEILRILGKGGMGTVYLARDRRLGRQVALKVLNAEQLIDEEARARFMREARTAAVIRHPNVATIYEVGETDTGQPFLVMEYCEGETLSQRVRRRPVEAGEFLVIARQLAAGMAAAHETGVIHRDIKAANVIIEPTGAVKILDFGLAKLLTREVSPNAKASFLTTSGQFFGTLHFLAPEQARGSPADERSDLFSIGVVLYQIASGHLPFNADAPLMVLEKIRDSEPEPFVPLDPAFPPAASRIISRLLQKNPADRYRSARDLLRELDEVDTPTIRGSMSHSRSMLGRTKARPGWAKIAVALAALIVVGIVTWLSQRGTPEALLTSSARPPAQTSPIRSMAVLPLSNLANNPADDFLSVSLADALVTKLQTISSLQVRPTSAVMEYRDHKVDSKTASDRLKVDGILEGHFLAAGNLVRVNLQLTDSRSGYSIWADSVDGRRDNLLKLIDDVSARTLTALNERLGVKRVDTAHSEARSSNPEAYEQYLRARALNGSFVPREFGEQIQALKRAVQLDPNFAAANADLAIAMSLGSARSLTSDPDTMQKAEWYARQAVRLDPNLGQAHLALGRVFVRTPGRFRESAREVLAALRLNATDTLALNSVATYFVSTGDTQKTDCIADRIVRLDPASNEAKIRGYWYINAVDPEGALQNSKWALQSKDTEAGGHDIAGVAYIMQGNLVEAEREAAAVTALNPNHYLGKSLKAMIASARGDRAAAEAAISSFEGDANRNHWAAIRAALCYAKLGDHDKALQWVRRSAELGHHSWYEMIKHPWLQSLQTDPEYQAIVARIKTDLDDVRDDMIGVYQMMCQPAGT